MSTRWQIFVSVPTTRVGFLKKKYKKNTILEAAAPLILISRHLSDFSSSFFLVDHESLADKVGICLPSSTLVLHWFRALFAHNEKVSIHSQETTAVFEVAPTVLSVRIDITTRSEDSVYVCVCESIFLGLNSFISVFVLSGGVEVGLRVWPQRLSLAELLANECSLLVLSPLCSTKEDLKPCVEESLGPILGYEVCYSWVGVSFKVRFPRLTCRSQSG
ncbi:hypothetical protein CEXT_7231 [Caerostris extrusa]|uniref:Uncharacterized protein n=1 Tax=Caerostris extrusa TaxID=172846 RepID=A0AAV4MXL8_CAEEX|nr:hypothetical protein CEXT_7231 [Caerostris extrusa]